MAKHGCHRIDLDVSKYSSPVPVIGLYIAGATMVCFLLMLYDIISGFLRKKHWLPCRLFSLNSVTLSLIAIAAKIPVDLTTSMPSALDQFSKLTGTTIICTSMAVLLPSVGSTQSSDTLTNLASLSIFVVTVVVNICVQIRTRVIVLFVPEHIIIMCCMLLLLILLWDSALAIKRHKDTVLDVHKELLTNSDDSMMWRLKLAYMCGYTNNPQFLLCKYLSHNLVSTLCIICLVVIIQAASRFLSLEFCRGFSQYDWSIWIIVVTQIVTITLGAFANNFRRFALFPGMDILSMNEFVNLLKTYWKVLFPCFRDGTDDDIPSNHPLFRQDLRDRCKHYAVDQPIYVVKVLLFIVLLDSVRSLASFCVVCCADVDYRKEHRTEWNKYNNNSSIGSRFVIDEWSLGKGVEDMKRWMEGKSASLNYMFQLLSKKRPSTRTLEHTNTMEITDQLHPDGEGIKVTSLSLVVLVRIAQVSIPSKLSASLVEAYSESHEIIHFIFDSINSVTMENRKTSKVAQAVWRGDDFSRLLPELFEKFTRWKWNETDPSEFDRASSTIQFIAHVLPSAIRPGAHRITDFIIKHRAISSIEDLYNYIEQLFVDMLHMIIAQLPVAIFKYVTESPAEEIDERVKLGLKILCQVEQLETHVRWLYPAQSNISSLITDSSDRQEVTGDGNVSSLTTTSDIRIDFSDPQEVTGDGDCVEISVCVD